jgi:hypothetical protein
VFKDTKIWHVSRYPIYTYHGNLVVFDGIEIYGLVANAGECCRRFHFGDYLNVDTVIRRATVIGYGFTLPYATRGTTYVTDSFVAWRSGISIVTSGAPGDCPGCSFPNRAQVLRNVRFAALPGYPLRTISMDHETHGGSADTSSLNRTFVYDYQGQVG